MIRSYLPVVIVTLSAIATAQEPESAPPTAPTLTAIRDAIEQPIDTPRVRAVACAFRGTAPTIHYPLWKRPADETIRRELYSRYEWKTKGFAMEFNREDEAGAEWKLANVWMFDEGIAGYAGYRGELPKGVAFGAPRVRVEKELGTPKFVIPGLPNEPWQAGAKVVHTLHKQKGLAVSYIEKKGKEPVVAAVALFEPGSAPHWSW